MGTVTKAKLALTVMGLIFFAAGVRLDDARLRVIAIVLVAVAWAMRFIKSKPASSDGPPEG
ncbi:MAG TPA: hypothetical protein PKC83_01070 [Gemmatimonadaceae bacterium]|jgi:hypothetical protein|nr:hypothetical protein [Gemmatimonadaceae bacterium]